MDVLTTRMHSSGMRTARLLIVSQHALGKGVTARGCLPGGVSAKGVCLPRGCLPRGGVADTLPVDRQTPVKT